MTITKRQILNIVFLFCLGLLLNSLELVTIKKVCEYPELGPHYYGFPMIYRTNMTWVNTGSGIIFILNWLINILFWVVVSIGLWNITKKILKLKKEFPKSIILVIIGISIFFQLIKLNALDLRYELVHNVKMNYYHQEINCESKFLFFNFGGDCRPPTEDCKLPTANRRPPTAD